MRRVLLSTALAVLATASLPAAAVAEHGPIQLISKSTVEQASQALYPDLSGDGRYVAFDARIGGREGLFREDLTTRVSTLVLAASLREAVTSPQPSISDDGRFIAFATKQQLDPRNDTDPETEDVYVVDMAASPPTFELASSLDGCDPASSPTPCGLTYTTTDENYFALGSVAAGRVAISADGRRVAFLTHAASNLDGPGTEAGQVAVRDLDTDRTYTMTVDMTTGEPLVSVQGADEQSSGVAISADGSTVAWVGRHLPEQVPMLAEERAEAEALEARKAPEPAGREALEYHEPLWRRVPTDAKPDPVTRRVTGGGDPTAPGCPPGGSVAEPACQGPFPPRIDAREEPTQIETYGYGWGTIVPQLSADGDLVAFLGNPDEVMDLFTADMTPGAPRRAAVRRVTRWINPVPGANTPPADPKFRSVSSPVAELALSPDGSRIAFTTLRQVFPLAPPTLITPQPSAPSPIPELYEVNLGGGTIERITPGVGTEPSAESALGPSGTPGGAASPSFSDNGRLLAFSSGASNIVRGDGNEAEDVFLVADEPPSLVVPSALSPRPPEPSPRPKRRLTVAAVSMADGSLRLVVGVPGPGQLRAVAHAAVEARLRVRAVASAGRRARTEGSLRLDLDLSRRFRRLARRRGGIAASVRLVFQPPGGKPASARVRGRFQVRPKKGTGR